MKSFRIVSCESEAQLEKYVAFVYRHKSELYPSASARKFLAFLCNHMLRGQIYIGVDEDGELWGTFVFTFGTPYRYYNDTDTVQVNIALLRPDYRHTTAFVIGMTAVMEAIGQTGRPVKEIHFIAYRHLPYLHKIYGKFAEPYDSISDRDFKGYRVTYDQYVRFCQRFGKSGRLERG